jgi:hypothetical protein
MNDAPKKRERYQSKRRNEKSVQAQNNGTLAGARLVLCLLVIGTLDMLLAIQF